VLRGVRELEKIENSSSLPLHAQGKKKMHTVIQNNIISCLFFLRKKKNLGSNSKMGYDIINNGSSLLLYFWPNTNTEPHTNSIC